MSSVSEPRGANGEAGILGGTLSRGALLKRGLGAAGAVAVGGSLVGSPAVAGAAPDAKRGGTLKLAKGDAGAHDSLDPALSFTGVGIAGCALVYDGLIRVDNGWNMHPMLAEDWTSNPAATVWTFKLRRGVQFHDGTTFSSADVAWAIKRILDKKTGSGGLGLLSPVLAPSGISTPDPNTVKFTLKAPDAFFGIKMGHYYTRIPEMGTTNWVSGSPGTGAFKNVSFKIGEGFEMVRNPNYWDGNLPYLDGVTMVVIADTATKQEAVLSGDVDLADDIPFSAVQTFKNSSTASLASVGTGPSPFTYDINSSIKPYSDPLVSQALKMAINRPQLMNLLVYGYGHVSADSLVAPTESYYPHDLEPFPYDPDQAKALLAKAGYSTGIVDKIWTTTAYPLLNDGAEYAQQAWQKIGANMSVESVTSAQYLSAFLHQPIVMDYYARQHPAITFDLYYASTSPQNTTKIKDGKIDAWIREFKSTTKRTLQNELASEIIRRYNAIAAEIVPFSFDDLWPHKKHVQGMVSVPYSGVDYRMIYLA